MRNNLISNSGHQVLIVSVSAEGGLLPTAMLLEGAFEDHRQGLPEQAVAGQSAGQKKAKVVLRQRLM